MARRDRKLANRNGLIVAMARAKAAESAKSKAKRAAAAKAKKPGRQAAAAKRLFGYSGPKVQGPKPRRKVGAVSKGSGLGPNRWHWKVSRPAGTAAPQRATAKSTTPKTRSAYGRAKAVQHQRDRKKELLKKTATKPRRPRPKQLPKLKPGVFGSSFKDIAERELTPEKVNRAEKKQRQQALIRKAKANQAARAATGGFIGPKNPKSSGSKKTGGEVKPQDPVGARRYKPKPVRPPVKIGPRTENVEGVIGPKTKVQAENDGRSKVRRGGSQPVSPWGGAVPLSRLPKESGGSKPVYFGPRGPLPQRPKPKTKKKLPLAPQQRGPGQRRIGPLTKEQYEQVQRNRAAGRKAVMSEPRQKKAKTPKLSASQKLARWKQRIRELDAYEAERSEGFSKPPSDRVDYNSDDGKEPGKTEKPISFDDADRGDVRKVQDDGNLRDDVEDDTPKQSDEKSKKIKRQQAARAMRDDIKGVPRLIGGDKDADARARLRARYLDKARDKSLTQTEINRRKKRVPKTLSRTSFFSDQKGAPPGRAVKPMGEADYKGQTDKRQGLVKDIQKNGRYPNGTVQKGLKPGDLVRLPDGTSGKLVSTGVDPKTNRATATVKQSRSTGKAAKTNLLSGNFGGTTLKNKVQEKAYKRKQAKLRQETVTRTADLRNVRPAGGQPASITKQGSPLGVPWSTAKTVVFKQHDKENGPQRLSKAQVKAIKRGVPWDEVVGWKQDNNQKLSPAQRKALDEATAKERARYLKKNPGATKAKFPAAVMSIDNPINDGPLRFASTGKDQFKASGSSGSYAKTHGSGATAVWDKATQTLRTEDAGGNPDAGNPFKPDPGGPKNAAAAARGGSSRPGGRGSLNTQLKTRVATPKTRSKKTKAKEPGSHGRKYTRAQAKQIARGLRADPVFGLNKASSATASGALSPIVRKAGKVAGAGVPLAALGVVAGRDKTEKSIAAGDTAASALALTKHGRHLLKFGGLPLSAAILGTEGVVKTRRRRAANSELAKTPESRRAARKKALQKKLRDKTNSERFAKGKAPRTTKVKWNAYNKEGLAYRRKRREIYKKHGT